MAMQPPATQVVFYGACDPVPGKGCDSLAISLGSAPPPPVPAVALLELMEARWRPGWGSHSWRWQCGLAGWLMNKPLRSWTAGHLGGLLWGLHLLCPAKSVQLHSLTGCLLFTLSYGAIMSLISAFLIPKSSAIVPRPNLGVSLLGGSNILNFLIFFRVICRTVLSFPIRQHRLLETETEYHYGFVFAIGVMGHLLE